MIFNVELGIAKNVPDGFSHTGQGVMLIGIAPANVIGRISEKFKELKDLR